ncbi:arylamine N-acetyltransferase family protein [Pseudoneobacillus sp. C159]
MNQLNDLFRKRIGLLMDETITFETLGQLLEKIATTIPFENLKVIAKTPADINKENLVQKILVRNEGGLCYELNTILYYFLRENGFDVQIARAIVFDQNKGQFAAIGRTHVIVLLNHGGLLYVVDTGFGGNLPLRPVPLSGEMVSSFNGEFRIDKLESEHGNFMFEMKLRHKDTEWKNGYAFFSHQPIKDISEMNEVQKLINESPLSSLNKAPLITKLTVDGNITLTNNALTQWEKGNLNKQDIQPDQFKDLAQQHFQILKIK